MQVKIMRKLVQLGLAVAIPTLGLLFFGLPASLVQAQEDLFAFNNLIRNGNFEMGFYPVPELGFEPPDVGQVPKEWGWFKNSAYGKYNIYNLEGFGLVCPGDVELNALNLGALALHMQSTDQQDARLGVYQTVDVVKGQTYIFSISGTIQSMQGSPKGSDDGHKFELVFDHTGGADWTAIPNEEWTRLPWGEYELEFETSGPEDPDLATIEEYSTAVTAQSNKMTIFIAAWRKWADWRSVRFMLDCVSLVPASQADLVRVKEPDNVVSNPSLFNNTGETEAQEAATLVGREAPGQTSQPAPVPAPAESQAIIPDSGGVLAGRSPVVVITLAALVISGLLGAGMWNIRRKQEARQ